MRRTALLAAGWACCALAAAQVPAPAVVHAALQGEYKAAPAKLDRLHKSAIDERVKALCIRQGAYLVSLLKPYENTTGGLSLTKSESDEHSIRPNTHTAAGLAIMAASMEDSDFPTTFSRELCRQQALGLLHFVLPTHGAGGARCSNGKQWKGQWQSALWANSAGMAAWLLWNDLDENTRWLAARMICDEADRFVGQKPPAQEWDDTKAEENAWNATVITLAASMFPQHPRHAEYVETARRWSVGSFVRQEDITLPKLIGGKTLGQWDVGATIHGDYTLENHSRVHPDYMNTINMNLEQWLPYSMVGSDLPETSRFNTRDVYKAVETLACPDGGFLYVNGQDWQLHRCCHWFPTFMLQAQLNEDGRARRLAEETLQTAEHMMARTENGGMFLPEEFSFPSTQAFTLEMYAMVHLLLKHTGDAVEPLPAEECWESLGQQSVFSAGKFGVMRTGHSIASFSWGDQPMGMVLPLEKDLLLAPNERSLIGSISVKGLKKEQPRVTGASAFGATKRFHVAGTISRADGALEQRFAFAALDDGRAVYVDDVRVVKPVDDLTMNLGTLSILNDKNWVWHDGSRTIYGDNSAIISDVKDGREAQPREFTSSWVNVDDKLGIVIPGGSRHTYDDNKTHGNGRLEQLLNLNAISSVDHAEPTSAPVARTVLVLYPGQTHKQTESLAAQVKAEWKADGMCELTLDDGALVSAGLSSSTISVKNNKEAKP